MSAVLTKTLETRVRAMVPQIHATMAQFSELVCAFEDSGEWQGAGMRSCADWLIVHGGFDRHTADALLRAGHAARELPEIGEAFSAGDLSLNKVRSLSTVATAEDQELWVELARQASPPQLARMCRESRNVELIDAPERAQAQREQRGLRFRWDELGMLRLSGALPSEEGALVRAVVESFERRLAAERSARPVEPDPAEDPPAALRADALVMACHAASGGDPGSSGPRPSAVQMVVHVDAGVLTGETPNGRCHVENGPALSTAVARRLGCEAEVVTLTERDGLPIDAGRARQIVSPRKRRAVQSRDGICRFPGCAVPANRTQPHHIDHWFDLGPTETWNLVSLCGYHHHRHHDGEFDIRRTAEGDLRFETRDRRLIGTATGGAWKAPRVRAGPG
ncbi:MAG TPA: DUF222 domain-containing protein [Candidatus Dormibacteraeota bacterium]|jgi:hypothetical protein|nr:DUF222 domain-containing protein [Candidatus Dormibacteraeota bacterium]